tara:strand:- start:372 stop:521 length:150 start_codon:yes stop_codon:yes gene_type:complete
LSRRASTVFQAVAREQHEAQKAPELRGGSGNAKELVKQTASVRSDPQEQ